MAEMKDKNMAADRFDGIVKKQRGLLTREERQLIALKKAADQAAFEVKNCASAMANQTTRLEALKKLSTEAYIIFEKAQAALEGK